MPFHLGSEVQTPGLDPGETVSSLFSDPDSNGWLRDGWGIHLQLQVDHHVTLRLGAADQQIALSGWLERFGLVRYIARDQGAFAIMANSGAARPSDWHVAGFREVKQARKLRIPEYAEPAPHK